MQTNRHTEDSAIQTGFDWTTAYIIRLPGKSTAESMRQRQPSSYQWAAQGTSISGRFSRLPGDSSGYLLCTKHCCCRLLYLFRTCFPLSDIHNALSYQSHCPTHMLIRCCHGSVDDLGRYVVNLRAESCAYWSLCRLLLFEIMTHILPWAWFPKRFGSHFKPM